jgi:hypothetical protein
VQVGSNSHIARDDYKRYMQKVPRMHFVVRLIRLLKRRKIETEVDEKKEIK